MTTKAYEVFGGQNGYVPIYSDSHGGTNLGHVDNGSVVYKILEAVEEKGYAQIDKRVVQDAAPDMKVSEKGQYWIEKSHIKEVTPQTTKKMEIQSISWSANGKPVIEYKEI